MAWSLQAESAGLLCLAVGLMAVGTLAGQSVPQNGKSGSQQANKSPAAKAITSSAIWRLTPDFLKRAHAACDHSTSPTPDECFLSQMAEAGAPRDAVQFSRRLFRYNGGEFGVMWRFQPLGPVDMAKVIYPLRDVAAKWAVGSRDHALLLVNGDPPIIDVDDLNKLDRHGLEHDGTYRAMKMSLPGLGLWGGGRGGTMWEPVHKRPDGGQSFDIYYVLNPGRPEGRWISGAHFDWNFDAAGKFLGTTFAGGVGPLPD
jgi:hypothetical protein